METVDQSKAGYLMLQGHRITIITGPGATRYIFDPSAQKDADSYDSGVMVPAAIYADTLARLRRLTAEKRGAAR